MFEHFNDRARRAIVLAQSASRDLDHSYIGTEHILLGLLNEKEGIAARALDALGCDLAGVSGWVIELIGRGAQAPTGHIPFTPRAKKILELALREALRLGHNYIGTEHLLLGLLTEGEGIGIQILLRAGIKPEGIRAKVVELLGVDPAVMKSSLPRIHSPASCGHPDEALGINSLAEMRTIRCQNCGMLIGVLPAEASSG